MRILTEAEKIAISLHFKGDSNCNGNQDDYSCVDSVGQCCYMCNKSSILELDKLGCLDYDVENLLSPEGHCPNTSEPGEFPCALHDIIQDILWRLQFSMTCTLEGFV